MRTNRGRLFNLPGINCSVTPYGLRVSLPAIWSIDPQWTSGAAVNTLSSILQ